MLKVVSTLKGVRTKRKLIVGTHNGMHHIDDALATAIYILEWVLNGILSGAYPGWNNAFGNINKAIDFVQRNLSDIIVLRSRDTEELMRCSICIDVGGGDFDHHPPAVKKFRKNGIEYASAGLVWELCGHDILIAINELFYSEEDIDLDKVFQKFDDEVISVVDMDDTGVYSERQNPFGFVTTSRPTRVNNVSMEDYNEGFKIALEEAISILLLELNHYMFKVQCEDILLANWRDNEKFYNGILEIPSQSILWQEIIPDINDSCPCTFAKINFVICEHPAGGWCAQAVPPSKKDKYGQRFPFPKHWAGHTVDLPDITGVPTAFFVNGRFFVKAKTKEDVIALCQQAYLYH